MALFHFYSQGWITCSTKQELLQMMVIQTPFPGDRSHQAPWEHKKTLGVWPLNTNCLHQMQGGERQKKKGVSRCCKTVVWTLDCSQCVLQMLLQPPNGPVPSVREKSNWTCPSNKTPSKSYVPPDFKQQQSTWS